MLIRRLLQLLVAAGFALLLLPSAQYRRPKWFPRRPDRKVTSDAEGAMEGVVVSAKKAGSTVTVSVITDAQGHYRFPANRLGAGKYSSRSARSAMTLRAPASADVADEQTTTVDLKLAQDEEPRLADEQCGMDDELAGDRGG